MRTWCTICISFYPFSLIYFIFEYSFESLTLFILWSIILSLAIFVNYGLSMFARFWFPNWETLPGVCPVLTLLFVIFIFGSVPQILFDTGLETLLCSCFQQYYYTSTTQVLIFLYVWLDSHLLQPHLCWTWRTLILRGYLYNPPDCSTFFLFVLLVQTHRTR